MPLAVLSPVQLATLLHEVGVTPGPASPLGAVPAATPVGGELRTNRFLAAALVACARPDEVVSVRVAGGPGFAVCRKGLLHAECTLGPSGQIRLVFPLTRTQVLVALVAALSGDRPEPVAVGFHLRGLAPDLLVLRAVVASAPVGGLARVQLDRSVASALAGRASALAWASLAGADGVDALRGFDVEAGLARLQRAGHVRVIGDRLFPSEAAWSVLGERGLAEVAVGRRAVVGSTVLDGELRLLRVGDRCLAVRRVPVQPVPEVDLRECTRAELRALVAGLLLLPAQRAGRNG